MATSTAKRPQVPIAPTSSSPARETPTIRELSARFDLEAITLVGSAHNGAWHRAIDVARRMVAAGAWNGVDPIEFDAYHLHNRLFGVARLHPTDLVPGDDFRIARLPQFGDHSA